MNSYVKWGAVDCRVPMPRIWVRVVPDAATSWGIWRLSSAMCLISARMMRIRRRAMELPRFCGQFSVWGLGGSLVAPFVVGG